MMRRPSAPKRPMMSMSSEEGHAPGGEVNRVRITSDPTIVENQKYCVEPTRRDVSI